MSLRRVIGLVATALSTLLWLSCGQVYRPVVIPVSTTPPNPANFHAVFGISTNVPFNQGTALQIDVSGDTNIGVANMGMSPTHATILPNNSRVFVASAGSLFTGNADEVIAFTPAVDSSTASGLGNPSVFSLPNFGPVDPNTGKPSFVCSYRPDFLTTTQPTVVYLANFGVQGDPNCNIPSTDSVAVLSAAQSAISRIVYLPSGANPVAMAETQDAQHLYVVNQGNNTVTDLSPVDMSTIATISVGNTPVWAVARPDGKRVYVLSQGDGQLSTISTDTDTVISSQSVGGAGANFMLYDKTKNRLYVTNPGTGASDGSVSIFDATTNVPTPLTTPLAIPAPPPCAVTGTTCGPVTPLSVAPLPDGSRFYVVSFVTATTNAGACPDVNVTASSCLIPQLTVFDALSLAVKPIPSSLTLLPPSISLFGSPYFPASQYAVAPQPSCVSTGPYAPGSVRFRMFTTASADSSHVYVSMCDAGSIADIATTTSSISTGGTNTPDTLKIDLVAP